MEDSGADLIFVCPARRKLRRAGRHDIFPSQDKTEKIPDRVSCSFSFAGGLAGLAGSLRTSFIRFLKFLGITRIIEANEWKISFYIQKRNLFRKEAFL